MGITKDTLSNFKWAKLEIGFFLKNKRIFFIKTCF